MTTLRDYQQKYKGVELKDIKDSDRQKIAGFLVEREIKENMSMLIEDIFKNAQEQDNFLYDEIKNLYRTDEEILNDGNYDNVEECRDNGEDIKEVFEWWLISKWLYEKLNEKLEPVFTPNDFNYFWGRTCTGQAICCDYIIQEIAYETFIKD